MSAAPVEPGVREPTLRLRFADREYSATDLSDLFLGLDDVWRSACRLAHWEHLLETGPLPHPGVLAGGLDPALASGLSPRGQGPGAGRVSMLLQNGQAFAPPPFAVRSLSLASPLNLEISWLSSLAGAAGLILSYRTGSLFVRAVRDPERLGAWLPVLVESWHRHCLEAAVSARRRAMVKEATDEEILRMFEAAQQLRHKDLVPEAIDGTTGGRALTGLAGATPQASEPAPAEPVVREVNLRAVPEAGPSDGLRTSSAGGTLDDLG